MTFQFLAGTAIFSFLPMLPWFPTGPAGDVKFFALFHQFSTILFQVAPHTSVNFWHLRHHVGYQKGSAVIRFVAGAIGTWCNLSPVVTASRVIGRSDFVRFSGEGIVGAEVVLAIGCPNPRCRVSNYLSICQIIDR
jgi:hypothetical protein